MAQRKKPRPQGTAGNGQSGISSTQVALSREQIQAKAELRFGKPNQSLSSRDNLRFGRKGSVSVCLTTGRYFDFEARDGGHLFKGVRRGASRPADRPSRSIPTYRQAAANGFWSRSKPISGTVAETYLRNTRGITLDPLPDCIRFIEKNGHPALIVRALDALTNEPRGVEITTLKPDGSAKIERRSRGPISGAAVKLTPDEDVTYGLGICEGVEDGLSILSAGWSPVWSCCGTSGMLSFPVLPGIDVLTIFSDADDAGQDAAKACAERWDAAGREVRICPPPDGYDDPNDWWRGIER